MEINKDLAAELLTLIQGTKNFVLEQAPDVIQQLIVYRSVSASIQIVIAITGIGLTAYVAYKIKKASSTDLSDDPARFFAIGASIAISFGLFIFIWDSMETLMKIHYAPKVFLIEYFSQMVK